LADRDGDGLPIGQGHHYRRFSNRRGHAGGVDDGAALCHRWRGGQAHGRSVDGVGDVGHRWRAVDYQIFEVAARYIGNAGTDLSGIEVRVVAVRGERNAASGLVGTDGDGLAIAQGHGHWRLCSIGQGRGVHDLATFGNARRC